MGWTPLCLRTARTDSPPQSSTISDELLSGRAASVDLCGTLRMCGIRRERVGGTAGYLLRCRDDENRDVERQLDQGKAEQRARLAGSSAARHSLPAGDEMPGGGFPA